ncbi:MAG: DUF3667 domain-containing protein [Ferruginibacter sp.]|nr:DUF3667 domain-containing protein [Ferruginibacter sp.]
MHSICSNCDQEIIPGRHFCSNCGQKAHLHRLSWHDVTHDAIHYFTHADKGVFHLLIQLATKTGTVAREFVQGKRKKYFPPFNFFLIVAAIYVFVFTLNTKPFTSKDVLQSHPELNKITDLKKREHMLHIYERSSKAMVFMNKHSNTVAMLALPFIAAIFWLFYRRAGYNYIEHLVANMYMSGFTLLCQVIVFVPLGLLFKSKNSNYLLSAFFIFQLIYFSVFYYFFINNGTKPGRIKAFLVSVFVIVIWVILTATLIRLYISNGFWGLMQ